MKHVYIWESQPNDDGFWKLLCICLDNEGMGVLERVLQASGITFKIESQAVGMERKQS